MVLGFTSSLSSLSLSFITRVAPHCVNTLMVLRVAHKSLSLSPSLSLGVCLLQTVAPSASLCHPLLLRSFVRYHCLGYNGLRFCARRMGAEVTPRMRQLMTMAIALLTPVLAFLTDWRTLAPVRQTASDRLQVPPMKTCVDGMPTHRVGMHSAMCTVRPPWTIYTVAEARSRSAKPMMKERIEHCDAIRNGLEQFLLCEASPHPTFAETVADPRRRADAERWLSNTGSCAYLLGVVCREFMRELPDDMIMETLEPCTEDIIKLGREWNKDPRTRTGMGKLYSWECVRQTDRQEKVVWWSGKVARCVIATEDLRGQAFSPGPLMGPAPADVCAIAASVLVRSPPTLGALQLTELEPWERRELNDMYADKLLQCFVLVKANFGVSQTQDITATNAALARQCTAAHVYLFYERLESMACEIFELRDLPQHNERRDGVNYHEWMCDQMIWRGLFPPNLRDSLRRCRRLRNKYKRESLYRYHAIDDASLRVGLEDCRELIIFLRDSIF